MDDAIYSPDVSDRYILILSLCDSDNYLSEQLEMTYIVRT